MLTILRMLFACVLLGYAIAPAVAADDSVYSFGVVPQFEQRKLYAIWKPVIDELEKKTGLSFKLVTTLKINDFEKEYMAQKFDFAYMNPYFIVRGVTPGTYIPLVRDNKPHRGIVVVRRDGTVKRVADLAGKTVAFPSPNAIGATLMTRAELERLFNVTVEPLYVKTHSSVYLHVAKELAVAGGGVEKTLQEQDAAIRGLLTVLHTTEVMPNLPVAANRRIPETIREKVRRAFLELGTTEEGRAVLEKIPMKEVVATSMDEYLVIEKWGLDKYWDPAWRED
ncbi:MAG: phosphate/phosphite/phosphonate ABC transporter substrate-binding protein [Nitrospirota bacterium]|nr:phosphate/phosphite/phosphonate ABC transporter substrate-binding protein [Nitrospirota bacterium]